MFNLLQIVKRLIGQQEAFQEEASVIRQFLADAGIMSSIRFAAQLHRHRFDKIRVSSGWKSSVQLADVSIPSELSACVSRYAGEDARRTLRGTSRLLMATVSNTSIYVCGGISDGNTISKALLRFRSFNGCWEELPPMLIRRAWHVAGLIAGQIYVCAGANDWRSTTERFCPWACKWQALKSMHSGRSAPGGAVLNGSLYIAGGDQGEDHPQGMSSAEVFHPGVGNRGEWEVLPPMLVGRSNHAMASCAGQIFALGGLQNAHISPISLNSLEAYNPVARSWRNLPPMPRARHALRMVAESGYLFACGGVFGHAVLGVMERFDIYKGTWHRLNSMLVPRAHHGMTVSAGRIYVIGGGSIDHPTHTNDYPDDKLLYDVECFDLITGQWSVATTMPSRRMFAAVVSVGG